MLEIVILGETTFCRFTENLLEVRCKITRTKYGDLCTGNDATNTDAPYFTNKALLSLSHICNVSNNGVKISNTNKIYAHKAFIKQIFRQKELQKYTWLGFQGYNYDETAKIMASIVALIMLQQKKSPRSQLQ